MLECEVVWPPLRDSLILWGDICNLSSDYLAVISSIVLGFSLFFANVCWMLSARQVERNKKFEHSIYKVWLYKGADKNLFFLLTWIFLHSAFRILWHMVDIWILKFRFLFIWTPYEVADDLQYLYHLFQLLVMWLMTVLQYLYHLFLRYDYL